MIYADTQKERQELRAKGYRVSDPKDHFKKSAQKKSAASTRLAAWEREQAFIRAKAIAQDTVYQVASQLAGLLRLRSTNELGVKPR